MKKINLEDYTEKILKELPSGILLTTKSGDRVNSMVIGWGALGVCWGRDVFTVYVREGRFTRSMLDENPEFTINIPTGDYDRKIMSICGSKSGRDIDKISEAGLTLVEPDVISVPALKELPLTLECKVLYRQAQVLDLLPEDIVKNSYPKDVPGTFPMATRDPHVAYYGEIVSAYIAE